MILKTRCKRFLSLFADAERIFNSNISWKMKYDLIFSDHISKSMKECFRIEYYDPDTSYEEDVTAWYYAAEEKAEEVEELLRMHDFD